MSSQPIHSNEKRATTQTVSHDATQLKQEKPFDFSSPVTKLDMRLLTPNDVLYLQRTLGNQYVQGLIAERHKTETSDIGLSPSKPKKQVSASTQPQQVIQRTWMVQENEKKAYWKTGMGDKKYPFPEMDYVIEADSPNSLPNYTEYVKPPGSLKAATWNKSLNTNRKGVNQGLGANAPLSTLPNEVLSLILEYTDWPSVFRLARTNKAFLKLAQDAAILQAPYLDTHHFALAMRVSLDGLPFTVSWLNQDIYYAMEKWLGKPLLGLKTSPDLVARFKVLLRKQTWPFYLAGVTAVKDDSPAALHRRDPQNNPLAEGPQKLEEYTAFYKKTIAGAKSQGKIYNPVGYHTMVYNIAWMLGLAHAMHEFDLTIPLSINVLPRGTRPEQLSALFREVLGLLQHHYAVTEKKGRTILSPKESARKAKFEDFYIASRPENVDQQLIINVFDEGSHLKNPDVIQVFMQRNLAVATQRVKLALDNLARAARSAADEEGSSGSEASNDASEDESSSHETHD